MRKQTKLVAVLSAAALLAIGASMTSFAATPHWDMEDNEWVYLDRNGDRVTDEWKKSNGQWYYLDENGYMARDMIIEDDDDKYYVDENGARVTNAWVSMDNDDLLDDDNEPEAIDTVWMYFDSNGKALGVNKNNGNGEIKKLNYGDGQSGYFIFDNEGYMLSGWKKWDKDAGPGNGEDLYYLGGQNEGWAAASEWKYLEVDTDLDVFSNADHDGDEFWFYFKSSGKACVNKKNETIGGKKYAFDGYGRMLDLWTDTASYSNSGDINSSSSNVAFYKEDSGDQAKGWVQVYPKTDYNDYDDDPYWFYLNSKGEPYRAGDGNPSGIATRVDDDDESNVDKSEYNKSVFVKSIKNESYLLNNKGVMLTGLYYLGGEVDKNNKNITSYSKESGNRVSKGSDYLEPGFYYFEESSGSVEGQMVTNRKVKIEVDDEDETYYFKKSGEAYINTIASSTLYGWNGQMVNDYGDGSTYERVALSKLIGDDGKLSVKDKNEVIIDLSNYEITDFTTTLDDIYVMVNENGKIKQKGTVKDINEDEWEVKNYIVEKKKK